MPFTYWMTACILTFVAGLASADDATRKQCTFYTGANTNSATCDDIPDLTCIQGCGDNFVVAEGCQPRGSIFAPLSTQLCNVEFGRNTADIKTSTCITTSGQFSCTGKTSGLTHCYGCVPTRTTHNPGPSGHDPSTWLEQSPIPVRSPSRLLGDRIQR
ncbi:hypothetical protein PCANC_05798 [Puccinia coronata f. sp. avenae]|uniref:Uncharacterized protein n=1 Tax=Puccinia coronata f. sp. avenae TaxID=200324 RepID=A0A2N5VSZ2_9BASI|nr:hypothetical protein PCANC_05798 [Puccinia coronata f. sp. avenae]